MSVTLTNVHLSLAAFALTANVTLNAPVTALFGASGSGKTSLLELIAGLRRPESGAIRLDDTVLVDTANRIFLPPERRAIGYVPQDAALFPHLSVRANLRYGQRLHPPAPDSLNLPHVTEVLEIGALLDRLPATLSAGERQRVALGRALLAAPRLLLLDEPLASLDLPLRFRLMPYLVRVRDEFRIPLLYVTHSPEEVIALCQEALVLERGHITRRGKPEDLFVRSEVPRYELRPDA